MDAMRYSSLGGGKRLRPFLVVESSAVFGVPREAAFWSARRWNASIAIR
jgi:farnesyl diphosphate synthase